MKTTLATQSSSTRWHPLRVAVALAAAVGMMATRSEAQVRASTQVADTPAINMPVPASVHQLRPQEVVAQIISQRHELLLSDAQFAELQGLHEAVSGERAIYEKIAGRSKPPYGRRPVWITTPEQALAQAFTILTPQQQHESLMLFARLERAPS